MNSATESDEAVTSADAPAGTTTPVSSSSSNSTTSFLAGTALWKILLVGAVVSSVVIGVPTFFIVRSVTKKSKSKEPEPVSEPNTSNNPSPSPSPNPTPSPQPPSNPPSLNAGAHGSGGGSSSAGAGTRIRANRRNPNRNRYPGLPNAPNPIPPAPPVKPPNQAPQPPSGNPAPNAPSHPPAIQQPLNERMGLRNTVNSCYQNSVLQMLHLTFDYQNEFHFAQTNDDNAEFKEVLSRIFADLNCKPKKSKQWSDLTEELRPTLKAISTDGSTDFTQRDQQDAHDFLSRLLDHFDELKQWFTLHTRQHFDYPDHPELSRDSSAVDPQSVLSVEVEGREGFDLQTLLDDYQSPQIAEDAKHPDDPSQPIVMFKSDQIHSSKYLFIQLNRFECDEDTHECRKTMTQVKANEEIVVQNKHYRLYGAVIHRGSLEGGHYWAIGTDSNNVGNRNQKWWEFNDEQVTESSLSAIQNPPNKKHTPYLLFYVEVSQ